MRDNIDPQNKVMKNFSLVLVILFITMVTIQVAKVI